MTLRQISCMGGEFVSDDPVFNVLLIRQAKMLFWCDVTEHRRTKPSNHLRTYCRSDVVVARSNVSGEWTAGGERRLVTSLQLLVHVLFDQMHRNMTRTLNHDLTIVLPRNLC